MTILWRIRIAAARWLLGAGPDGYDFYFAKQVLHTRRQRTLDLSFGTREDAEDFARKLNAGLVRGRNEGLVT
jgi:hypothetical protein